MFQNFVDKSEGNKSAERVAQLRSELARQGVDAFIVPRSDEHQGEYVAPGSERLAWISGFTGSAGTAIITGDEAVIFVDGRYTVQVREQTDAGVFKPLHLADMPPRKWISKNLKEEAKLAYDPWLHTMDGVKRFKSACTNAGAELVPLNNNPIDAIWDERPAAPASAIFTHPTQFAGRSVSDKAEDLAASLEQSGLDAAIVTIPESIAWAFNIRASDVPHTPIPLCFAILHKDEPAELFVEPSRLEESAARQLDSLVNVKPPEAFINALAALTGKRVGVDPIWTAEAINETLRKAKAVLVHGDDPCLLPKAKKNAVEQEGARVAHIRDGAAMARFLHWLSAEAGAGAITEIEAARKLESFRIETGMLKEISFDTISGAGANAALPHYRVSETSNRTIEPGTFYLVDSGAQYEDGTTDITRTIAIGTPSDEMRDRYTRVLKGHIAIARARFPKGTTGAQIDTLARMPLWQAGLDFDHGTGHGVGSYLSVHEGPQRIAKTGSVALEPGMILSNEPGYYKEGHFGIRIENLVIVRETQRQKGEERDMYGFETITFTPIDTTPIDVSLLDDEELEWLNAYHLEVFEKISPSLSGKALGWLKTVTRALHR
ncbi:MAG: aminopeptidase P family protein [Hyphomicrobiales bacterium]